MNDYQKLKNGDLLKVSGGNPDDGHYEIGWYCTNCGLELYTEAQKAYHEGHNLTTLHYWVPDDTL